MQIFFHKNIFIFFFPEPSIASADSAFRSESSKGKASEAGEDDRLRRRRRPPGAPSSIWSFISHLTTSLYATTFY